MICPSGVTECAPDRSWNIGSVMSSVTPCREPGRDRTRTTPARHQLVILRLGGVPLVRHGATVWDRVAWHGPTDRIVASAGCFPIQRMLVQMHTCVRVFASVRLRFFCLLAHVVAQRQQRARTGWERHQWCKPTFGSVGENVNSVYALTVFTYSTINSIPKACSA
jgi:hypothetical protein